MLCPGRLPPPVLPSRPPPLSLSFLMPLTLLHAPFPPVMSSHLLSSLQPSLFLQSLSYTHRHLSSLRISPSVHRPWPPTPFFPPTIISLFSPLLPPLHHPSLPHNILQLFLPPLFSPSSSHSLARSASSLSCPPYITHHFSTPSLPPHLTTHLAGSPVICGDTWASHLHLRVASCSLFAGYRNLPSIKTEHR